MIQVSTILNVIDNSGAKTVCCLKVFPGFKRRYAFVGDIITVSIKSLRHKRKSSSKVKKGEILKALIVQSKKPQYSGDSISFFSNSVILLNKQNKLIGTRVFGAISNNFRYSKYLKVISVSSGIIY
jgi:large subunit ribosomal protein L14